MEKEGKVKNALHQPNVMLSLPSDMEIVNWARETTKASRESNLDAMEELGKITGAKWMRNEIKQQLNKINA